MEIIGVCKPQSMGDDPTLQAIDLILVNKTLGEEENKYTLRRNKTFLSQLFQGRRKDIPAGVRAPSCTPPT